MPAMDQKYTVDLADVFDRVFSDKPDDIRYQLRNFIHDSNVKYNIGREVVRKIRERTESGVDRFDRPFKSPYSKSYQKSLAFQVYGKSKDEVNLKLSGQMLANMQANVPSNSPKVVVDFASDLQNAKADGHIRGGGRNGSLPVRDFFGLPDDEEDQIVKDAIEDAARTSFIFNLDDF